MHSLFAEFAAFRLAALDPGAAAAIHRRASLWFRSRRLCGEAVEHAVAAGDGELAAEILVEHYFQLIRTGQSHALHAWVRQLEDDQVIEHPVLAVGGAMIAMILGRAGDERRRYLALAGRAEVECPERATTYVRSTAEMVRAGSIDRDVGRAVESGWRAVEFARKDAGGDASVVAALACYSRALYFAGEVEDAWEIAMQAIEHPDVERRPPGQALARTALAFAAIDRGWLSCARDQADGAKSIVDDLRLNRTWLGANVSAALGCLLLAEGALAEAETKLASAEHFFHDDLYTVPQAWLLVRMAEVRCRRGRLDQAQATLASAFDALETFTDARSGPDACGPGGAGARTGAQSRRRRARCSSSRATPSAPCSGCWRPISRPGRSEASCSSRRTPCARTRGRCIASSASTRARPRSPGTSCWVSRVNGITQVIRRIQVSLRQAA